MTSQLLGVLSGLPNASEPIPGWVTGGQPTEQQLRAIGGWKSGVVSKYVHIAAQDAKEVLAKMNKKILGGES